MKAITIFLVTLPLFAQRDITDGPDATTLTALPKQEIGLVSALASKSATNRAPIAQLGVQWSWLLLNHKHAQLQYLLEGRPYVNFAAKSLPSSNGWIASPAGLRATFKYGVYAETQFGLGRTRLTTTELAANTSQYSRIWELGGGVQVGKASGTIARFGYHYLRGANNGPSSQTFQAHLVTLGVFFRFSQ